MRARVMVKKMDASLSAHFVRWTWIGAGAGAGADSISWNCGSGRRPGGLASLVQQHEVAASAKAATAAVVRMRIMVLLVRFCEQFARITAVLGQARR